MPDDTKSVTVSVRLTMPTYTKLRSYADKTENSIARLLRLQINNLLKQDDKNT